MLIEKKTSYKAVCTFRSSFGFYKKANIYYILRILYMI